MRLRTRLILGITAVALLPLLLLQITATRQATHEVTNRVVELHVQKASNLATFVDTYMFAQIRALDLVMQPFQIEDLSDKARIGFQRLVYQQFDDVNIVSLLDGRGMDLAPSQMLTEISGEQGARAHELISQKRFNAFRKRLPTSRAFSDGFAIGEPYTPPDSDYPVVPIAISRADDQDVILGVELSLKMVVQQLESQLINDMEISLLDDRGGFIIRRGPRFFVRLGLLDSLLGASQADLSFTAEDGEKVLAAFCEVASTGWIAVVAEPYDTVVAAAGDIRLRSAYFGLVAAFLAVVIGAQFANQIHRPVIQLRDAVMELGAGNLGRLVDLDKIKEFAELGRAFNTMSRHLKESLDEIEAQRREIEAFNLQLQARVEERTRELQQTQHKLLESGKLAAVAELGAGLAHELNNPLAGVLGITQILKNRLQETTEKPLLESLESQALRCSEILRSLQNFTGDGLERGDLMELDLDDLMAEVVGLVRTAFRQRGVSIEHRRSIKPLPIRADRAMVGRALLQLLTSLRVLARDGGALKVQARASGNEIELELEINPVKPEGADAGRDDWYASGMSLWVARRILAEHGGRLKEPGPDAQGRYVIVLPRSSYSSSYRA